MSMYARMQGCESMYARMGNMSQCMPERGEGFCKILLALWATWFIYGFTSRSRIFHLYGDVTIAGEGLQNLGLCSGPLSREGSLSCHTSCDTGPRFFRSHPKDHPIQSPLTTHEGVWRIYSNPDPHGPPRTHHSPQKPRHVVSGVAAARHAR
jgi:hypothetical protein